MPKHLLISNLDLSDLISKRPSFFFVKFEQVFYEIFFDRKSLITCFVVVDYYTFLQD